MRASLPESSLRWVMISLAFFATLINYLDRQALSIAAPILQNEFHLSSIDYSHVLFAFMLAYTIANGASGMLIDRLGTRSGYAIFVAWWSLCAMMHVVARGVWSLGIFRFLIGMGEAGNWPGAVRVVAEWFRPEERSLASGIFNSGSAAGAILAPPLIAGLVLHFGWRSAFVAVGSLGFVWVIVWAALYRAPVRRTDPPAAAPALPLLVLLRSRFVWAFAVSKIFVDPVWYFYVFWFPNYLSHSRHFNLQSIGHLAWIPFFVAGLGSIGGGLLTKMFLEMGMPVIRARKAAATVAAAMMFMTIPAVHVSGWGLSIAFVSIAMAGYTTALANMLAMPGDLFPPDGVASVYGLASMGSGFGGMIFVLITGWLVDRYSFVPAFWLFGIIPLIGISILWAFLRPPQVGFKSNKEPITISS